MERGGNFGFIDMESIESIGEDVAVERLFGVDETFSTYLRVRNFLLDSSAISLASNSRLFIGHVRYAPVSSRRAEWKIGSIIFLMALLAEL